VELNVPPAVEWIAEASPAEWAVERMCPRDAGKWRMCMFMPEGPY